MACITFTTTFRILFCYFKKCAKYEGNVETRSEVWAPTGQYDFYLHILCSSTQFEAAHLRLVCAHFFEEQTCHKAVLKYSQKFAGVLSLV